MFQHLKQPMVATPEEAFRGVLFSCLAPLGGFLCPVLAFFLPIALTMATGIQTSFSSGFLFILAGFVVGFLFILAGLVAGFRLRQSAYPRAAKAGLIVNGLFLLVIPVVGAIFMGKLGHGFSMGLLVH